MDLAKLPCPICGGTDYEIGNGVLGTGLTFEKPTAQNIALGLFKAMVTDPRHYTTIRARRCLTCNNVQLFANSSPTKP